MLGADTMGKNEAMLAFKEVTELRTQISSIEERLTEYQNCLDGQSKCVFCQKTVEYVKRIERLEFQCDNLLEDFKSLRNASAGYKRKYGECDPQHAGTIEILESRLRDCEADSGERQREIDQLKQDMSTLKKIFSEQKSRLDNALETIDTLSKENRNLKLQNHTLEARCNDLIARLSDRFLLVKLLGQLFVPPTFVPDGSSGNHSSPKSHNESRSS